MSAARIISMNNRMSTYGTSRRRRARFAAAGSIALVSVLAIALGGFLLVGLTDNGTDRESVLRVSDPTVAEAPEATEASEAASGNGGQNGEQAEREAAQREADEREAEEREAEERQAEERQAAEREAAEREAEEQAAAEEAAVEEAAEAPVPNSEEMSLTVPKMGRYDDPIYNTESEEALHQGAIKLPSTGFPWQEGANTYIAAHVYGYEGTGSWQQFAALPSMTYGDRIYLTDANGTSYEYEVTEVMTVMPTDTWVTEPEAGRDMITLQTCVGPGWSERLVVRADKIDTVPA